MKLTIMGIVLIAASSIGFSEPGHATIRPFLETGQMGFKTKEANNPLTGGLYECRDDKGRRIFTDNTAQLHECQPLDLIQEGGRPSTLTASSSNGRRMNEGRHSGGNPTPSYSPPPDFYEGAMAPPGMEDSFYHEDPYMDPSGMPSNAPPSFPGDHQEPRFGMNDQFAPGSPDEGPPAIFPSQPNPAGAGLFPFGLGPENGGGESEEVPNGENHAPSFGPNNNPEMNSGENQSEKEVKGSKEEFGEGRKSCALSEEGAQSSTEFQVVRDPESKRITKTVLGVVSDFRQYDNSGCVQSYRVQVDEKEIYAIQYNARDDHGRITELTETLEGITTTKLFAYDEQGQLAAVTQTGSRSTYQYDARGNRLKYEGPEGTFMADYDAHDPFRLMEYGDITYSYYANGAVESQTTPQGSRQYSYDNEGKLSEVIQEGSTISYQITPENGAVDKLKDGVLIKSFKYENNRLVSEWNGQGMLVNEFSYDTQGIVPDFLIRDGDRFRIVPDHVGSPRLIINATTGEILQRLDYDPFGKVLRDTGVGFQPLGFAGGLYDQETKLVQLEGRWYDPHPARWITSDPSLSDSADVIPYVFKNNDPINNVVLSEQSPSL